MYCWSIVSPVYDDWIVVRDFKQGTAGGNLATASASAEQRRRIRLETGNMDFPLDPIKR
jgi:hypothetical protein